MWWIWLLIALGSLVAEIAVSGLVFGGIAGAAVAAGIVGVIVPGILPGAIAFLAVSIIYLVGLRGTALRLLTGQTGVHTALPGDSKSLMGRHAIVTEEVTGHAGQIRIGKSEYWSARAFDGKDVIPEGATVEIVLVEGLSALVARPA
jgi:membrane protein implicated in regulation of membrane protease activity